MRAVVLAAGGLPELAELPEPTGPGTVVQVRGCGLCGSDVEKLGRAPAGTVLGHEVDGVLEDGTRVTVLHRVPCGSCDRCLAGHESTCTAFETVRIAPGGFSERLRATSWLALPDSLGELEGIWVEPLACILRAAGSVPRGRVLVVGCGAMGLLWTQVLRDRGDAVVAADPRPDRLARAAALGAGSGATPADAAVVTAPAGLDAALRRLEPGGTLLVFAAPPDRFPVDVDTLYRRELRILGSRSATPASFDAALAMLPGLELPETTRLPLERFAEGVERYRSGETPKVVFTP